MAFFSICVPQYNRTSFLVAACRVLETQTFRDFEVCISDDCSTDGRGEELRRYLDSSGLNVVYRGQELNRRYDGNLREAISLASGRFCLLMGNDDCLASPETLERLHNLLIGQPDVGVVITNFRNYSGDRVFRRVAHTGIVGAGPGVAANCFRNFSFVSGILLERQRAQAHLTSRWDGSEMYQMYLACRILAEGYQLLEIDEVMVRREIQLPGETVDSYAGRPVLNPCPLVERRVPLVEMGRLVSDAITIGPRAPERLYLWVFLQILAFPYGYWIFEYRRVQSWKYALGICLGMRPRNLVGPLQFRLPHRLAIDGAYAFVSLAGLVTPIRLFTALYSPMYILAKRLFQPR